MYLSYSKPYIAAYHRTQVESAEDAWMSLMRELPWEGADNRKAKIREGQHRLLHLRPSCPYSARRLKHHTITHHPPYTYTHSARHIQIHIARWLTW